MRHERYCIEVTADENDGDYLTEVTTVSREELLWLLPYIRKIRASDHDYGYNYDMREWTDLHPILAYFEGNEKDYERFDRIVPHGEHGVHTIDRVAIYPAIRKRRLL